MMRNDIVKWKVPCIELGGAAVPGRNRSGGAAGSADESKQR